MHYLKYLFYLLLMIPHLVMGQLPVLIEEDFSNNKNQWGIGNSMNFSANITGGKLEFINKNYRYSQFFLISQYLEPQKDFIIGTTLSIQSDFNGHANGLTWGANHQYYHQFLITKMGSFRVIHNTPEGTVAEVDFQSSEHIDRYGENKLAIAKTGEKLVYFINGHPVYESLFDRLYGFNHGVMLGSSQVSVSDFVIRQAPTPINLVDHPNNGYVKENLGRNINTRWSEISPKVSSDGQKLFICRADNPFNLGAPGSDQDAWVANRISEDEWEPMQNMGIPINDAQQNAVASVSSDQNTLLLNYDGRTDPGLMRSVRTASGWSKPERVIIENFYNYNRDSEFALAPNGKVLVYSVEREDTYGEKDLYVSFLREDGTWSAPKNMGSKLNTFTTDFGPFIAADGKTLYFASMGHPGYGSSDIYVSKRLDDTWTNWSEPKNLGPEINTKDWDAYYTVTASGKEAFLSSASVGGGSDIFRIDLDKEEEDKEAAPDPVVLIKGKVFDQNTKKPMGGVIIYEDLKTGKEVGVARSDPKTGAYQIALPYGISYGFLAKAKGYVSVSENMDLTAEAEYKEEQRDLYLAPIKVGETINLKNVFFQTATASLLPSSFTELERVVSLMRDNPSLRIKLKGHTDNLGPAERLLKLSLARAEAVRDYLVEKGVEATRLSCKGYGGSEPLAPNNSRDNQQRNRRVEFEILEY